MYDQTASWKGDSQMGRSLTPFSRITILLTSLNSTKLEDLLDVTKCDLLYHTSKLPEEIEDSAHKESAMKISQQGQTLFDSLTAGNLPQAKIEHQELITAVKNLKRLL